MPSPATTAGPPPIPLDQIPCELGGFWIRTLAHVIDSIILSAIITPLMIALVLPEFLELVAQAQRDPSLANPFGMMGILNSPAGLLIQYALPSIAVILLWRWRSATPGKMILHLVIVDADTLGKPSTLNLLIRFFGYLASMLPFFLGFLWVGWDPRKQGWHDKLANTLVIRRQPS